MEGNGKGGLGGDSTAQHSTGCKEHGQSHGVWHNHKAQRVGILCAPILTEHPSS